VGAVTDRRHGPAVALFAEVVAALHGPGRMLPSASPVAVGRSPASTQWVKVPRVASGSSHSTASSTAPSGTPDHFRAGDRLSWSFMADRDRLVLAKGRAAQLDAGHR
jgi:hypothetical protein